MTEPVKSGVTARNQAHAAEQIAELLKECRDGVSDREEEAVAHARLWGLEHDPVREDFADARAVRARLRLVPEAEAEVEVAPEPRPYLPKRRSIIGQTATKKISPPLQSADVETNQNATKEESAEAELADQPAVATALFAKELPVPSEGPPILSRNVPMDAARKFCDRFCWINGSLAMYSHQGDFYRWNGSHYTKIDEGAVLGEIYAFLDGARVRENGGDVKYVLRARDANEILECLRNGIILPSRLDEPYWLNRKTSAPTVIAFKNKIYDYATGGFQEPTPNLWVTDSVDLEFDPNATAPRFERFLKEIFPGTPEDGPGGDVESQQCILEQLGYGMTNETKFDKAALWYGVLRSGKSTLARIQHKLVGDRSFVAIDLHNLTKTENSAQLLIGKKVAVAGDVRMRPSKWYGNNYDPGGLDYKVAQLILKVTGRDDISLGRKYKDAWEGRLTTKFIIITNDVPNFGDVANVLPTRFIKIHFKESFEGREDNDLQDVLDRELPGIANLCLVALKTLLNRGRFIQPASSKGLEQRVLARTNPLAEFMQDNWVKDDTSDGPTCAAFYSIFTQWACARGHAQLVGKYPRQKLIQAINDLAEWGWLKSGNRTQESGRKRRYPGIRRKAEDDE